MKKLFNQKEVSRLIAVSESQIRYWDKIGLIPHSEKEKGQLLFDFKGLVAFRTIKELLNQGLSLRRVRKCIEKLRAMMPDVNEPLSEMRIFTHGGQIVLCKDNLKFTPEGQLLIDFAVDAKLLIPLPVDRVEELFFQALEVEQEERWAEASRRYEAVLALKPDHVNALVNMGNMMYQLGSCATAEAYYRKALRIDPDHLEANYNLANILEERGDLDNAIVLYLKSIHEDPEFADAHFNLARALEGIGDMTGAKKHWQRYLVLDPSSQWADYVKKRVHEK